MYTDYSKDKIAAIVLCSLVLIGMIAMVAIGINW